jgi:hypothetical protein
MKELIAGYGLNGKRVRVSLSVCAKNILSRLNVAPCETDAGTPKSVASLLQRSNSRDVRSKGGAAQG